MRVRLGETRRASPGSKKVAHLTWGQIATIVWVSLGHSPGQGRRIKSKQTETQIFIFFFNYITVFSNNLHSLHVSTYWGPMRLPGGKKGTHPPRRQITTIVWGTLGTPPTSAGDAVKPQPKTLTKQKKAGDSFTATQIIDYMKNIFWAFLGD